MSENNFIWGVANSAFQVEGNLVDSDWRQWTQKKSKIKDAANAENATQFWNKYDEDFALAKDLGCQAFRLSIAWERIEPQEGQFNEEAIEHYRQILRKMKADNLEPFLTLNHFVLPLWLSKKGGYAHSKFHEYFVRFALKIIDELGVQEKLFKYCITFNEPMVLIYAGYMQGIWPPGKSQAFDEGMRAAYQMALSHIKVYQKAKELYPEIKLGIAQHWRVFQAKKSYSPLDQLLSRLSHWCFNVQFVESLLKGKIFFWTLGSKVYRKVNLPKSNLDFLGINYYGRMMVGATAQAPFVKVEEGPGEKTDLGWEIYPQGLEESLRAAHSVYKGPLFVTENGLADARDEKRSQFLEEHIKSLAKARSNLPVKGYFHWSLTDNFEWAEGLEPRFGLVEINYETGERNPRPSFHSYKKIIQNARQ